MFRKFTNSFLKDFTFEEIMSKFSRKEFLTHGEGSFIFSENDPALYIYFILSGGVEIKKSWNRTSGSCVGPGDLVGVEDVLTGEQYCYSTYVLKKTDTVCVEKKEFLNIMNSNDVFNLWILKYLSYRIDSIS